MNSSSSKTLVYLAVACASFLQVHAFLPILPTTNLARSLPSNLPDAIVAPRSRPILQATSDGYKDLSTMKAREMKYELESYGISTYGMFTKEDLQEALEDARAKGLKPKEPTQSNNSNNNGGADYSSSRDDYYSSNNNQESDGGYADVEVITDDSEGPRQRGRQDPSSGSNPFAGGGNPFGGMSGGFNQENMQDLLRRMGGDAGGGGGFNFGGGATQGNPFGGTDDAYEVDDDDNDNSNSDAYSMPRDYEEGDDNAYENYAADVDPEEARRRAQELMKNPKVMEVVMKAQRNPKIAAAIQDCMKNPAAVAKYRNDPDILELLEELGDYL